MGKLEGVNVAGNQNEDAQGRGVFDERFEQNIMKALEEDMTYF